MTALKDENHSLGSSALKRRRLDEDQSRCEDQTFRSPRIYDAILAINPYKLLCDAPNLNSDELDSMESHLQSLLKSVETIKHVRRDSESSNEKICILNSSLSNTNHSSMTLMEKANISSLSVISTLVDPLSKPLTAILPVSKHQEAAKLDSTPIPTPALRQIASSGFLSSKELGRLLLLTSKSYMSDLGTHFVHYQLCQSRWRYSINLPQSLIDNRGYSWLYERLCKGMNKPQNRSWPNLQPPKLKTSNVMLLVSIHDGNEEVISQVVKDDDLQKLMNTGEVNVSLDPIPMNPKGNSRSSLSSSSSSSLTESGNTNNFADMLDGSLRNILGNDDGGRTLDTFARWTATIHAIRLDNHKCCCVHRSTDILGGADEVRGEWNLQFLPEHAGLELTDKGKAYESRIREHDRENQNLPYEGIYFAVSIGTFKSNCSAATAAKTLEKSKMEFSKLKIEIQETYDLIGGDVYNSVANQKTHQVTAMHLLENVRGLE